MLDVGFSEILLTSAIALIVLGPERLPKVARQVGNWMGRARAMARQLSEQLEREVSADELLKQTSKAKIGTTVSGAASAFDTSHTPPNSIAPPALAPTSAAPEATAPLPAESPPNASAYEHFNWGADAAATTPEAMHAADPKPTDLPVIDSHASPIGYKPPHE
jgi:sec-independent protein translocase protein TatB